MGEPTLMATELAEAVRVLRLHCDARHDCPCSRCSALKVVLAHANAATRDAARLAWLIEEGYVTGLRRYSDDSWTLEVDIDRPDFAVTIKAVQGATWREAVDNAMGAAEAAEMEAMEEQSADALRASYSYANTPAILFGHDGTTGGNDDPNG